MDHCAIAYLDELDERDARKFWRVVERELQHDDGEAAKVHLQAGRPIYYVDERFENEIVRKWPNGTQELVTLDSVGQVVGVRGVPCSCKDDPLSLNAEDVTLQDSYVASGTI